MSGFRQWSELALENAKLRADIDHLRSQADADSCAALVAENAELRKRISEHVCPNKMDAPCGEGG